MSFTSPSLLESSGARPPEEIVRGIAGRGPALVALSGGVDSSVVATLAFAALGTDAHAVTLVGPAVSEWEKSQAIEVARAIGIRQALVPVDPLELPQYRANPSNRCYFCRVAEGSALREYARLHQISQLLDGIHLDDLGDDRPGIRAMEEAGFSHPLVEAAWHKRDVRSFARERALPNWDRPSEACLSSRIQHGDEISEELLRKVEAAEAVVRAHGFRRVRVRVAHGVARIVVGPEEVVRLTGEPDREAILRGIGRLGFDRVEIDPVGYRPRSSA